MIEDENHYTDEPWTVDEVTEMPTKPFPGVVPKGRTTYMINHVYPDADPKESDHTDEIAQMVMDYPGKMSLNNACRIMACVNNCKGINPYAMPYLLAIIRRVLGAAAGGPGVVPEWIVTMVTEAQEHANKPWIPGKELSDP